MWLKEMRPALLGVLVFTILTGVMFPAVITGIATLIMPGRARGSLVEVEGRVVGSALIGQNFAEARYFHPRPSSAGSGYDAGASSGSNLGPTSQKLIDLVRDGATTYREENGLPATALLPADAATRSASGLDPHVSPENARLQVARVAAARGVPEEVVMKLVADHTEGRTWGVLGEPRVNVLELNLALDREGNS